MYSKLDNLYIMFGIYVFPRSEEQEYMDVLFYVLCCYIVITE